MTRIIYSNTASGEIHKPFETQFYSEMISTLEDYFAQYPPNAYSTVATTPNFRLKTKKWQVSVYRNKSAD